MDRRKFLQISAVGAVAITLPLVHCKPKPNDLLEFPGTLSSICDEKTIRELGQAYLQKFPAENKSSGLQDLLMEGHLQGRTATMIRMPSLRCWIKRFMMISKHPGQSF